MQSHRTDGTSTTGQTVPRANRPPQSGRVRGLGLVDALEVQLDAIQIAGLLEQIDGLREVHEDHLNVHDEDMDAAERDRRHYRLKVLAMIRAQIPADEAPRDHKIVGPQAPMTELVLGATRVAGDELRDDLYERRSFEELSGDAAVLLAWTDTYLELQASNAYGFDPECDPIHADELE